MRRRVVVTGIGVVSPLGNDAETTWRNLLEGRSGIGKLEGFPTDKLRSDVAASVRDFEAERYLSAKEVEIHGRVTHFSVAAAVEAMNQAGISPSAGSLAADDEEDASGAGDVSGSAERARYGCLMSTGMGSVDIFEEQIARSAQRGPRAVSPFFIPGVMPNSATAVIAIRYGLMGPSYSLASACCTGTHSIATSALMIESGDADVMVAGGAEAATRMNTVAGFGNARALARAVDGDPTKASRPFDRKRQGFVMAEGAGVLVLEEEQHALRRGAKPLAYIAGFGMTTDATHLTRPDTSGSGLVRAMQRALERAELGPEVIGYINPHATSTPQGDAAEVLALRSVFGERLEQIPISATKSMLGHMLGGAGAVETIAVVCSLRDQALHPSINVEDLDPAFSLELVKERRSLDLRYAIKVSAGFGGHNCALVLERAQG
ncbi:beta-ketoacyl-[acyl-carrier-protein] synthase family protein [Chondromyces crocatus]|uniref:Nodulation protein E n=1 Tax=Chondromyces crocatus TaxID=52 RepID=A0A0K1EM17_CHOCO|nr:beta-ketoacyl-[acyl-carrier-protein] synthase family protein [Chondromyces crocatus]AKT41950.1 3-oxoacyl-ACP synthase [Chondromyces crocatus]